MTGAYPYSRRELLAERYDYMYTPFDGPVLLSGYVDARRDALARWRIGEKEAEFETLIARARVFDHGMSDDSLLQRPPGQQAFEMEVLLRTLWFSRERRSPPTRQWDEALLKRFEVTKRVYPAYDAAFVRRSDECRHGLYARLAAYFAAVHRERQDVRYLNATLKLNDILCSIVQLQWDPAGRLFAMASVRGELEAVTALLETRGIDLG
jgi:hypothetical protein